MFGQLQGLPQVYLSRGHSLVLCKCGGPRLARANLSFRANAREWVAGRQGSPVRAGSSLQPSSRHYLHVERVRHSQGDGIHRSEEPRSDMLPQRPSPELFFDWKIPRAGLPNGGRRGSPEWQRESVGSANESPSGAPVGVPPAGDGRECSEHDGANAVVRVGLDGCIHSARCTGAGSNSVR